MKTKRVDDPERAPAADAGTTNTTKMKRRERRVRAFDRTRDVPVGARDPSS
jgi:hypothetical protein